MFKEFFFYFFYYFYYFFEVYSFFFFVLLKILDLVVCVLLSVAFMTLFERKVMGASQKRVGPNVVGFSGLLQPIMDGVKLLLKELVLPVVSDKFLLMLAPTVFFVLSFLIWVVVPFGRSVIFFDINLAILYIFSISSLGVYGIVIAGWASNSRYAFLGCLRSAAQMIAYEVSIGLIVICVAMNVGSLSLLEVVEGQKEIWNIFPMFPLFLMFFVSALAETNRPPFDLPEAEAELVSGYNVEYSSVGFVFFFIGEYSNILFMAIFIVCLFLGGWHVPQFFYFFFDGFVLDHLGFFFFILKFMFVCFSFIMVRVALPRFRYDQLMSLGWKVFLPLTLGLVLLHGGFLLSLDYFFSF